MPACGQHAVLRLSVFQPGNLCGRASLRSSSAWLLWRRRPSPASLHIRKHMLPVRSYHPQYLPRLTACARLRAVSRALLYREVARTSCSVSVNSLGALPCCCAAWGSMTPADGDAEPERWALPPPCLWGCGGQGQTTACNASICSVWCSYSQHKALRSQRSFISPWQRSFISPWAWVPAVRARSPAVPSPQLFAVRRLPASPSDRPNRWSWAWLHWCTHATGEGRSTTFA